MEPTMEKKSPIDLLALDNLSKLVKNVTQDLKLDIQPEPPVKKWRYLTPDESTLLTQLAMGCKPKDQINVNPGWADRVIPMETLVRGQKEEKKKDEDSDDHPLLEVRENEAEESLPTESSEPEHETVSEVESQSHKTTASDSDVEVSPRRSFGRCFATICYIFALVHAIIGLVVIGAVLKDELYTPSPSEFDELAFTWNPEIGMSSDLHSSPYEVKDLNQVVCQRVEGRTFNAYRLYYIPEITATVVLRKPAQNGTVIFTASSHLFAGHEVSQTMDFRLGAPTKVLALKFNVTRSIFDLPITYLKVTIAPSDDMPYNIEVPCSDVDVRNKFMLAFAEVRQKLGHTLLSRWY